MPGFLFVSTDHIKRKKKTAFYLFLDMGAGGWGQSNPFFLLLLEFVMFTKPLRLVSNELTVLPWLRMTSSRPPEAAPVSVVPLQTSSGQIQSQQPVVC